MNAILICPADRAPMAFLARHRPLALFPVLGRSLLDLWLSELASRGIRRVLVLAPDRPHEIRQAVGRGELWGLDVHVLPERREPSIAEARDRHAAFLGGATPPAPHDVILLDHLPSRSETLWDDPGAWPAALLAECASVAENRIGMRELAPGIHVHRRARVAPDARLEAPCWIGAHSWIGPRTRIGPDTVIEEGSYIDEGADLARSLVGPSTYVGAMTELRDSIAWGRGLVRHTTGSATEIHDRFLLADLALGHPSRHGLSLLGRCLALLVLVLTSPVILVAWWHRPPRQPLFVARRAVRTPALDPATSGTRLYHEFAGLTGLWKRWPQLWNVVRGEFAWVGNRPLAPDQASLLADHFEQLWLHAPTGLVSLADAEGCGDAFGDEARVHASFYAARHDWRLDRRILRRAFARAAQPGPAKVPVHATST